jgi:O-antigen ligase
MLVGLGGHLAFLDEPFGKTVVWSLFSLLGNLLGMLQFETPVGIVLFVLAALLMLGYWGFFLPRQPAGGVQKLKLVICVFLAVVATTISLVYLFPEHPVKEKAVMLVGSSYYENMFHDRQFQSSIAWKMWQDYRWTGVGAGGFIRYGQTIVNDADRARLIASDGFLSNDWLQFLMEYGVVGSSLLVALVIILLIPLFSRLRFVFSQLLGKKQKEEVSLADIDPYVVSGILALIVMLLSSFLFSPLQSGAIFASFVYVLAVIPGLLPAAPNNASEA